MGGDRATRRYVSWFQICLETTKHIWRGNIKETRDNERLHEKIKYLMKNMKNHNKENISVKNKEVPTHINKRKYLFI